jgi:ribonuclease Z
MKDTSVVPVVLRALTALSGALLLIIGVTAMAAPWRLAELFALHPMGNAGYNSVRGDFGALFLGLAVFTLAGAIINVTRWLAVPAMLLGLVLCGRLVSLVFDGASPSSLRPMAIELAVLVVLLLSIMMRRRREAGAGSSRASTQVWARVGLATALVVASGLGLVYAFQRPLGLWLVGRAVESGLKAQSWFEALPDGLHAGLCGSGAPLADASRAGPCVFVVAGRQVYIVDVGEGSPRKLALMGLPPSRVDAVLLTHFHSDHIGGLGELLLQRWAGGSHHDQTPVYGPPGVDVVVNGFNAAYRLDTGYRVAHHGAEVVPPGGAGGTARTIPFVEGAEVAQVVLEQDGLTIRAFPVVHTPVSPALGYRFDYKGRSVVVSGDTAPSRVLEQQARGVDVLLHEGLQTSMVGIVGEAMARNQRIGAARIMADIPSYHTTPEDAARLAARAGVRHLVFYHTIPPLRLAFLNAAFLGDAPSLYRGPITVSNDGTLVSLPSGSTVVTVRELF